MNKLIIIAIFLSSVLSVMAQPESHPSPDRMEKMESLKIAFITSKLSLTSEEAARFWPVYNAHHEEARAIRKDEEKMSAMKNLENMSDDDISKMLDDEIQKQAKMLDLQKAYLQDLKKVLPLRKIALLQQSEREFKRELLKMSRDRQGPPQRPPIPERNQN
jgi:hypothetical protein